MEKLDNGLTVALHPNDATPVVTADFWVRAGAGDEPAEVAGISHFLEHMLFKGTERLAPGEYDRRIEYLGGYLNAATSLDYTHYFISVPSENFLAALADFADVIQNARLDAQEMEHERQVILEEISRKNDNPFGYLFDIAFPGSLSSGAYTHPVIGSAETVSRMTRGQLFDHYQRYYTGDNSYLVISGDVDRDAVMAAVREAFDRMPARARPHRQQPEAAAFHPPRRQRLDRDWQEAYFIFTFPAEAHGDDLEEMAAADLLETLLVSGRTSRLRNEIVEKKALANSIGAYFPTTRYAAPFLLYGVCAPERVDEVREAIFTELERLRTDGITGAEMRRIRRQAINGHLYSLETNNGRTSTIGYSYILLEQPDLYLGYEEALERVGEKEILSLVERYLLEDMSSFYVTARFGPDEPPPG